MMSFYPIYRHITCNNTNNMLLPLSGKYWKQYLIFHPFICVKILHMMVNLTVIFSNVYMFHELARILPLFSWITAISPLHYVYIFSTNTIWYLVAYSNPTTYIAYWFIYLIFIRELKCTLLTSLSKVMLFLVYKRN